MSEVEAWLDETPGETRGVIAVDGRFTHILIDRDDDMPAHRLGARSIGRITQVAPGLNGAFVDLGADGPLGFLPGKTARVGEKVEVEVTAEPRERKGPVLRRLGAGEGEPRLLQAGPGVVETLATLAAGVTPVSGAAAIRVVQEAEEAALSSVTSLTDLGLDVCVERTRALIAVDLDLAAEAPRGGRDRANRVGLIEAARLIGLKRWGGLTVIDLIGGGQDGEKALASARAAFAGPDVGFGPVSRFGLIQVSLPWTRTPIEEALDGPDGRRRPLRRAIAGVRALRLAVLENTAAPRLTLALTPEDAALAAPLVARLGPRAAIRADAAQAPGAHMIGEERP